jgi:dolichyl-phosphate beta-glucosyltransferase
MSDVDESVPLTEFSALAPLCGNAIVCGSRKGGKDMRPFYRRFLSWVFNSITGAGVDDSQCGFKLFNMALMRDVFDRQKICRFAFDVELILKAASVASVHVKWQGRRRSSLKVWRDAPRMLWDLIRIRFGI